MIRTDGIKNKCACFLGFVSPQRENVIDQLAFIFFIKVKKLTSIKFNLNVRQHRFFFFFISTNQKPKTEVATNGVTSLAWSQAQVFLFATKQHT